MPFFVVKGFIRTPMAPGQDPESEESALNVNVLKEIARKDLVDALNSVG
jgi:hypothetical protein